MFSQLLLFLQISSPFAPLVPSRSISSLPFPVSGSKNYAWVAESNGWIQFQWKNQSKKISVEMFFFYEFRLYFLFQFLEYTTSLIFTFFDLNIYMSSYLRWIFSFFCSSFFSLPPLYLFLFLFHFSFFIPISPLLFLFLFLVLFILPFFSVGHSCNKQTWLSWPSSIALWPPRS